MMQSTRSYILGLEQLGYGFLNEIRIFSQAIGQPTTAEVTFNIYRELFAQVLAAYRNDDSEIGLRLASLPVWPTILYVEDREEFFDIKREFGARVRYFAMALYGLMQSRIPDDGIGRHTYLMESVSATVLIVNVYSNINVDAELL